MAFKGTPDNWTMRIEGDHAIINAPNHGSIATIVYQMESDKFDDAKSKELRANVSCMLNAPKLLRVFIIRDVSLPGTSKALPSLFCRNPGFVFMCSIILSVNFASSKEALTKSPHLFFKSGMLSTDCFILFSSGASGNYPKLHSTGGRDIATSQRIVWMPIVWNMSYFR